jgi:beta-galactosidase/beta-glucuronidase
VHRPGSEPDLTGSILVPFPAGSQLSGLDHVLQPDEVLTVRRRFVPSPLAPGERLRLHFGAVDWACEVHVNGHGIGSHHGGFEPFHFDITDALTEDNEQELVVSITDPTDTGD